MKWYKRDPAAALEGMAGLTIEERGFYNGVIDAYFARDGRLPDDDWLLSRILSCNPRTVRKLKVVLFLKQKLRVTDGNLVPNRGEETLQEGRIYSELQRNRARMRWERREIASKFNGPLMPSVAMPLHPHKKESSFSDSEIRAREESGGREEQAGKKVTEALEESLKRKGLPEAEEQPPNKRPSDYGRTDLEQIYAAKHNKPK